MAFDAAVVNCFIKQAKDKIINSKIDKIHQPHKDEIYIVLRSPNGNTKLYISANASYPRIFLTDSKYDNPAVPPMFCMLLRKQLTSGKITDIYQVDYERIIVFEIECYDELRTLTKRKLIIELMGKHSNIILTDKDDKIIDSIKRVDISTSSVRQILPALFYNFPPKQEGKFMPFTENKDLVSGDKSTIEKEIMEKFYGVSKLTAREIEFLSEYGGVENAVNSIFSKLESGDYSPCIIYKKDMSPVDFSAIKISQYGADFKTEKNSSISYIIEKFYHDKAMFLRLSQGSAHLLKVVTNNIERCEKKLGIFKKQLLDSAKRDKFKEYGELITANLYQISENTEAIEVVNYFDENLGTVKIKLDPSISPAKNAQKYFAKYNKAKIAEEQANIQIKRTQKELNYLETVLDSIQRVSSNEEIKEIKEELALEGYIHSEINKKKRDTVSMPKKYEFDDFTVYVGKNNRQNDYLTLKIARSNDIWLHTKNIPGSHVIISKPFDKEIPDEIILEAAKLAALNSKAKGSAKTPVDYTLVKNVKKPSGAKPGMVIYDHYNTIYVDPVNS